ncbi:hypothetical protein C8Q80DRAFT_1123617 [Daedaleopsis nitida]|nr:hypothetical protein C8Q80DRAFT_1123617 [Daedaleopsis nitida]
MYMDVFFGTRPNLKRIDLKIVYARGHKAESTHIQGPAVGSQLVLSFEIDAASTPTPGSRKILGSLKPQLEGFEVKYLHLAVKFRPQDLGMDDVTGEYLGPPEVSLRRAIAVIDVERWASLREYRILTWLSSRWRAGRTSAPEESAAETPPERDVRHCCGLTSLWTSMSSRNRRNRRTNLGNLRLYGIYC